MRTLAAIMIVLLSTPAWATPIPVAGTIRASEFEDFDLFMVLTGPDLFIATGGRRIGSLNVNNLALPRVGEPFTLSARGQFDSRGSSLTYQGVSYIDNVFTGPVWVGQLDIRTEAVNPVPGALTLPFTLTGLITVMQRDTPTLTLEFAGQGLASTFIENLCPGCTTPALYSRSWSYLVETPEPSAWLLLGSGLVALAVARMKLVT